MNNVLKEQSLSKALSAKGLTELPKQYRDDCGEFWLEAVVLVRKQNLTQSYCLAKRDADGKISYIADYGMMSPISGLISIHPYMYLDKETYMPYENIEQMRHALIQYIGGDEEAKEAVDELPDSEVQYQILQIAIDSQYAGMSIKDTHQTILDAVGVNTRHTITFESEERNGQTDRTDAQSERTDGVDTEEPDNTETPDIDRPTDGDKVVCDGDGDNTNETAVAVETIPEEKPKNKGGRPKGSKNTTIRKTTKK